MEGQTSFIFITAQVLVTSDIGRTVPSADAPVGSTETDVLGRPEGIELGGALGRSELGTEGELDKLSDGSCLLGSEEGESEDSRLGAAEGLPGCNTTVPNEGCVLGILEGVSDLRTDGDELGDFDGNSEGPALGESEALNAGPLDGSPDMVGCSDGKPEGSLLGF